MSIYEYLTVKKRWAKATYIIYYLKQYRAYLVANMAGLRVPNLTNKSLVFKEVSRYEKHNCKPAHAHNFHSDAYLLAVQVI